jgi:thymidine phosphorylase
MSRDIIAEFITKGKAATDNEAAKAAINEAIANGKSLDKLSNAIVSLGTQGQDLKRPLGKEAASFPNTPDMQNLFRVYMIISKMRPQQ